MQQSNLFSNSTNSNVVLYKGFITPGQNINKGENENKCLYCKEKIVNKNIDICKKCFKSKIIDELYSSYLECLEKEKDPMKLVGNILFKMKKNENPNTLTLNEALAIYNKSYNDDKLDRETIINEVKKKVCILCWEDLKGEGIKLPCNCYLCNREDLNKYLRGLKQSDLNKAFYCNCSKQYNREMLYDLAVLTNEFNLRVIREFVKYFNTLLSPVCCVCAKTDNILYYTNDLFSSNDENEKYNSERYFLRNLRHQLCGECYEKIMNTKTIDCKICKKMHYFNNNINICYKK